MRTVMFFDRDMPNMASHCDQKSCGYSIYRGVLVQWDEDHDERVFDLVDQMPPSVRDQLLVIQEHEASVGFVWGGVVPSRYKEGQELYPKDGDVWHVIHSISASASKQR